MSDVLLTVKEYAALFRSSEHTVYRSVERGELTHPVVRITKRGRILIRVPADLVSSVERIKIQKSA